MDDKEKNSLYISDININERSLKYKIFHYFNFQLKENKKFKTWILFSLIVIESIQFISYAFSSIHFNSWKMERKKIKLISDIISTTRLSLFLSLMNNKIYSFIIYFLLICIFGNFLIVIIQILFNDMSSKFYKYSSSIVWSLIDFFTIFLFIPIIEIILTPCNCINGKILGEDKFDVCWKGIHYLKFVLGIIGAILFFIFNLFMVNFSFSPFQKNMSTIKINSNNDIIIIIIKLFMVLQNLLIENEYISLAILLFMSIIMFYNCFIEATYNNIYLEYIINIKNSIILWTYFVLLISKLFQNYSINGFIYLLVIGYPIIIYFSVLLYKEKEIYYTYLSGNSHNLKDLLNKIKFNIKLINSFIEKYKNNRSEKEGDRNILLLKGNIKVHNYNCPIKDCPLKKFMKNEGNYNLQKQCLLNYMNYLFQKALKQYPNNTSLLILFISFNYSKKFNLNSVKAKLFQLKKLRCKLNEEFIIYCLEQNIKNKSGNELDMSLESDKNITHIEIIIEQKYQKLKFLIENSTRLFGEFWGIFSTNVTNNLNTKKLYLIGERLNKYLKEINSLWENELKNKKIESEYQSIVHLYSKFLLEILWNKQKSSEVIQKIKDENKNFQDNLNKKKEEKSNTHTRIEEFMVNQDFILFADCDEKGNCKIIQISASLSHFLGYQKYDIIGKKINAIIPNMLIEDHCKSLEELIKSSHNEQNSQKEISYRGNDSNENSNLFVSKNKMGYIFPLFISFKITNDNDYSDSFLIKIKFENKESKSKYGFYALTKPDFTLENISSSSINLGLTLDLVKKYSIKIDNLIRTINNNALNIYDIYNEYEDDPKPILWVFPDIIYPKYNITQNKNEDIEELIKISKVKKINLQIKAIKYNPYEISGFLFKFTEISFKRKKIINNDYFIPKINKHYVLFDLLKLKYFRSVQVDKKSGLRNLRNNEIARDAIRRNSQIKPEERIVIKRQRREKTSAIEEESSSSEESEKKKDKNILTKEKILELQAHHYFEIKNFILSLPEYGEDVSLEKFAPNGGKFSASKISDSLIKIQISNFLKRVNEIFNIDQNFKMKNNNNSMNNINSPKIRTININHLLVSPRAITHQSTPPTPLSNQNEDINKGIITDPSSTLINLFKADSIKYIKILVGVIFISILVLLIIEYLIVYGYISKINIKVEFLKDSHIILSDLLYVKFFITEGILASSNEYLSFDKDIYLIKNISEELLYYKNNIAEKLDRFASNKLCVEFTDFISNTNITIKTLAMGKNDTISLLYKSIIDRIPVSINNLANENSFSDMKNRDLYELMYNSLNEYYINWKRAVLILYDDCTKSTKIKSPLEFIIISFLLFSLIVLSILLKLIFIFSIDREKPINLFLTIKKSVFENLKNSADSFSNKLLNKLFGNEDIEEESEQEYQSNIQKNSINIVKFKSSNEGHSLMRKENSFAKIFFGMLIFILIYFIYFIGKYIDFRQRMTKIFEFIRFYNKVNGAHSDILLSFNIIKSYLYDEKIPILNKTNTQEEFINRFLNISEIFEDSIYYFVEKKSIINSKMLIKFENYLYSNCNELLNKDISIFEDSYMPKKMKRGLKPSIIRLFEILRLMNIKFFSSSEINFRKNISYLMKEENPQLIEINKIIRFIIRPFYSNNSNILIENLYEYQNNMILYYTFFFIFLITSAILIYFILWKIYEEKLKLLLKGSVDLINLIPQEIKNIIAEKLNE